MIYPSFQKSPIKPYENLFSHPFFFVVAFSDRKANLRAPCSAICIQHRFLKNKSLESFIYPSAVTKHIAPRFHFMHTVKAAEPESIRQPTQRRRKKRQRPDFDAPVFRLSALARVIRTQAAKKKGRKIDVDPAFPPEIRGVSDADLASTSAESPPARRPCVHQFNKVG